MRERERACEQRCKGETVMKGTERESEGGKRERQQRECTSNQRGKSCVLEEMTDAPLQRGSPSQWPFHREPGQKGTKTALYSTAITTRPSAFLLRGENYEGSPIQFCNQRRDWTTGAGNKAHFQLTISWLLLRYARGTWFQSEFSTGRLISTGCYGQDEPSSGWVGNVSK